MAERVLVIILGVLLLLCSIQDILKKKVFFPVIAAGAVLVAGCIPFCENMSLLQRLGGCTVGIGVILLSKATHGKIGMGDGILLCITGIGLGLWGNLELFAAALFFAALISIILLMLRMADRKKSIPFVPFLFAGFLFLVLV